MANVQLKEGEITSTIYSLIKDQKYSETVQILNKVIQTYNKSRPALSLLGFCHYQLQDFVNAADCYEQLTMLEPDNEQYKLYYAQSLNKSSLFEEATKMSGQISRGGSNQVNVIKLQAAIKYGQEDFIGAKTLIDDCPQDDADTINNIGCLCFKENKYDEALKRFVQAQQVGGEKSDLIYNVALCNYITKRYNIALPFVSKIISKGINEHSELAVGMNTEGLDARSVGNTMVLYESALVEAFNLQAAIEFQMKHLDSAKMALTDMPPRMEHELDPVTLHNQALINMEANPSEGFQKLQFLLQQESFPPETFANLLLLYIKYEYYDLAADVLAENAHLTYKYLTPFLYDFIEAVILRQTAPEEAYRKLDDMATKLTEDLRKFGKQAQHSGLTNNEATKAAIRDFDETIEKFLPILMQQAKIYWDLDNFSQVEKIFHKSVEFCKDQDPWKLNVAHVLFMQENKYKQATGFYEPLVKKHYDDILELSAIVLANLCVSYIMTSQNEEAEELMRKIEKEEEKLAYDQPDKKTYHLCIVNLVIGTLYCAKGNYEFGISRVIKSLEPYQKKLGTDTWYYAKRCFLSMIENLAKHMIMLKDEVLKDCLLFLEQCEVYGRDVVAHAESPLEEERMHPGKNTVTYEARQLKALLLKLM